MDCSVFLKLESHAASYPNISMRQACTFSCQSKLQASSHHSVIGVDEKKTVTSILIQAFGNSSAAPSIPPPPAWQSRNNTNRCDFQMQNEGKSVVSTHPLPFSQWHNTLEGDVMNNKMYFHGYSIFSKTDFQGNLMLFFYIHYNWFHNVDLKDELMYKIFLLKAHSYGRQLKAGESDTHEGFYVHTCTVLLCFFVGNYAVLLEQLIVRCLAQLHLDGSCWGVSTQPFVVSPELANYQSECYFSNLQATTGVKCADPRILSKLVLKNVALCLVAGCRVKPD